MSWIEISFETQSTLAENASEALASLGALSISFLDAANTPLLEPPLNTTPLWDKVKIVGLFSSEVDPNSILKSLQDIYPTLDVTYSPLEEREWSRMWLEYFHPMQFGEKLWVAPTEASFSSAPDAAIVRLDPGLAFGAGTHPTTALCLGWLATHSVQDLTIIDYGCGSGILGIAALLLSAQKVWAVDHDPQALESTQDNAHRNGIDENNMIMVYPQDLPETVKAEIIIANILAEPLISLAPLLKQHCAPQGKVILSGILIEQCDAVKAAYGSWCTFEEIEIKEEWALLVGNVNEEESRLS